MDDPSELLYRCLVAVYRPYTEHRLSAAGFDTDLGHAIEEGEKWLQAELAELLELPYRMQRRSPLEVFQEALRFPTEALDASDAKPVGRDATVASALPGDRYGLAPASSQELGDAVWRVHLAWGASKASALAGSRESAGGGPRVARASGPEAGDAGGAVRPAVALVGTDLMDRSRVEPVVAAAGYQLVIWRRIGDFVAEVALALVDLNHAAADEFLRRLADEGVRSVAFGPHVDDIAMARAGALGATEVLPRSRFFRRLPDLLPPIV